MKIKSFLIVILDVIVIHSPRVLSGIYVLKIVIMDNRGRILFLRFLLNFTAQTLQKYTFTFRQLLYLFISYAFILLIVSCLQ